jgi:Fic family protein
MPGQYRNFEVKVGNVEHGGVYRPPHILDDIKMLMVGFTEWLNSEDVLKEYAFIRAILAHYYLEIIHPFGDGNGRTGRAIESLILHDFGFKYGSSFALWTSYYLNYDKYFSLLSKTRKENEGNQTEFIIFALSILNIALEGVYDSIINITDRLLFKDYVAFLLKEKEINQRQNAIVAFVLDKNLILREGFDNNSVIKPLYNKMSSRAFLRDMIGLLDEKELIIRKTVDGKEYYQANIEGLINRYN